MRVLLFTGKGGVGTTTLAAASAVHAARSGTKTLLLSIGAPRSAQDPLGTRLTSGLTEVEPGLFAGHADPRARTEQSSPALQTCLQELLQVTGADPVLAQELRLVPSAEDVLALLEVRDQVRAGPWDLLVVDTGTTAEALRLLALPELLRWCLARALPMETRIARALRPGDAATATGGRRAHDAIVDAADRLASELTDVRSVLADAAVSVRLVLTPESLVVAESRRAASALALHGLRVDGVVVNRVIPPGDDPWRSSWSAHHARQLAEVRDTFSPVPVTTAPYLDGEPLGADALAELARHLYTEGVDLLRLPETAPAMVVERSGQELVLDLSIPLAERRDVELSRRGDELVIDVGAQRRHLALPSALRRCVVVGASLRSGRLRIRFEPDPSLWRPL